MSGHAGIGKDLLQNSSEANGLAQLYGGQAAQANATLAPALTAEAVNPSGYTPTQMGAMTTGAEQAAGGSNAGATGGALLRAARTHNAGAVGGAVDAANRTASQNLSGINAGIQEKNADLQQKQHQQGLNGLESLYGTNVNAGENAIGLSTGALNDAGHLNNFWQDLLKQQLQNGSEVAQAVAQGGG